VLNYFQKQCPKGLPGLNKTEKILRLLHLNYHIIFYLNTNGHSSQINAGKGFERFKVFVFIIPAITHCASSLASQALHLYIL